MNWLWDAVSSLRPVEAATMAKWTPERDDGFGELMIWRGLFRKRKRWWLFGDEIIVLTFGGRIVQAICRLKERA